MTTPMNLNYPIDHGDVDIWGPLVNTALSTVEVHNHTTGQGNPIPAAALQINADVSWSFAGTNYAIKDLRAIDLTPVAASTVVGLADAFFANSDDSNELYYRSHTGTNIKITNSGALNVSIVGGIGGDYSSVGALLSYDDATRRYLLQQEGSPRPWAGLATADIDLYQKAASIVNKVTLKSPAALAASYAVTWPAALPATTATLRMDVAGALSVSPTTFTLLIPASAANAVNGSTSTRGSFGWTILDAVSIVYPIALDAGCKITGWKFFAGKTTNNTKTLTATLLELVEPSTSNTIDTLTNSANAPGAITLSNTGLAKTLAVGAQYYATFQGTTTAGDTVAHLEVTYTRP